MRFIFTLTIFIGAFLLFLVQPMFARMLLPKLGGSPSVWNTAMVFYQAALLAGYAYSHFSVRKFGPKRQAVFHLALICLPLLVLPIGLAAYTRKAMRFVLCLFSVFVFFISAAFANVRAGAPRPLQSAGAFIAGTHAQSDGANLRFVRNENARPALWRALADTSESKTPDWSTLPHREQSPYLLEVLSSQRAVSPDGKRVAYVARRGGMEAIYVVPFEEIGREERARRVVTLARNPAWLDASTLLYENTRPGRGGLFRIAVSEDETARPTPQLLFPRGGESAVSPDGQTICLAAAGENADATQLYLLAADGSGARAIPQTLGARRPVFSPDSRAIYYDAPAPQAEQDAAPDASTPRVLWTVPLQPKPPTAQLAFVREAENGDVEIVGTLFSGDSGPLRSRLEFRPGDETSLESRAQFELPVKGAPLHNGVLARWPLPRNSESGPQQWTVRLTAEDAAGETSHSTLTFQWPLQKIVTAPTLFSMNPVAPDEALPAAQTAENAPDATPSLPVPAANSQAPAPQNPASQNSGVRIRAGASTPPRLAGPLMALPTPALPSGNVETETALPPAPPSTPAVFPSTELPPAFFPPPMDLSPEPLPKKPAAPKPALQSLPTPRALPQNSSARKSPPKKTSRESGGIPAQMKVREKTSVTVTLRNTGSRNWSSRGEDPVRLIVRWVRADSNTRHRWEVKWLRETVEPGESTQIRIDLAAPPTAGRYILTYALVRLSDAIYDGKNYKPPSHKAADHRWPGEFGAVNFEINVVP